MGRQDLLDEIACELDNLEVGKRKLVLQGLGGVGKTQAAIEFLQRRFFNDTFDKVFWVDAASERNARNSFARIADAVGGKDIETQDVDSKVEFAKRYIQGQQSRWLLVLDNFDSPRQFSAITNYMPCSRNSSIIITSRHRDSNRLGSVLHVGGMNDEDAVDLLRESAMLQEPLGDEERKECLEIVHRFDNLPLAIDQAGAYMAKKGLGPSVFQKKYEANRKTILSFHPEIWAYSIQMDADHPEQQRYLSAFTTWELSLSEVGQGSPLNAHLASLAPAAKLLVLSAFFDRVRISEFYFERSAVRDESHAPRWLLDVCMTDGQWDGDRFGGLVSELADMNLLEWSGYNKDSNYYEFSLHPLVQEWARLRLDATTGDRAECILQAIHTMADVLAWGNYEARISQNKDIILSGLNACIFNDEQFGRKTANASLCAGSLVGAALTFASFFVDHGHYAGARLLYSRILADKENIKSDDVSKRRILNAKEGIAIIDMLEGHYPEAEKLCEEVMRGYTDLPGEGGFERLRALHNLTEIHGGQGNYSDCIENYTEIRDRLVEALGEDHYITLRETEGLGNACRARGLLDQAEKWLFMSKAGVEKILEPDDPDLLGVLEGCAILRKEQGRFDEAEELYQKALAGNIRSLGQRHPDTLNVDEELGDLYAARGDYQTAIRWYEIARDGRWEMLGREHSDAVRVINKIEELKTTTSPTVNYPTFFYPWYLSVSIFQRAIEGTR